MSFLYSYHCLLSFQLQLKPPFFIFFPVCTTVSVCSCCCWIHSLLLRNSSLQSGVERLNQCRCDTNKVNDSFLKQFSFSLDSVLLCVIMFPLDILAPTSHGAVKIQARLSFLSFMCDYKITEPTMLIRNTIWSVPKRCTLSFPSCHCSGSENNGCSLDTID